MLKLFHTLFGGFVYLSYLCTAIKRHTFKSIKNIKIMTNEEILKSIQNIQESLKETDLDVNVVNAIVNLRSQINQYRNPVFTKDGEPVMEQWNEFKYSGLSNCDYVRTEFYVDGWQESEF